MSSPLKLAFIGGALHSAVGPTHQIACQMDKRWQLVAGCFSTREEHNRNTAEAWGVPADRTYATSDNLLRAEGGTVDAVAILTHTPAHAPIVIQALELGIPVVCEKALGVSVAEIQAIEDARVANSGYLAVTYNYTGYPMLRELHLRIASGEFGAIHQIQVEMPQEGYSRLGKAGCKPTPQAWRLLDGDVPTLSLDLGVHLHHIIHFLTAQTPIETVALTNTFGMFPSVVDNTMALIKYTGDLDVQMWFGKSALGHSNGLRIRVYGETGAAEWFQMSPDTLAIHDNRGRKSILERSNSELLVADQARYNRFKPGHPTGFLEAFANHYYDVADDLTMYKNDGSSGNPWVFGVSDALEGLKLLEAIAKSASTRCWQAIEPQARSNE